MFDSGALIRTAEHQAQGTRGMERDGGLLTLVGGEA